MGNMRGLVWAIKFLTVIPIDRGNRFTPGNTGTAMVWFPGVGLFIGACLAGIYFFLIKWFPSTLADALILVAYIAITGGLHLDGIADSCDGIFGGRDKERRLEIMRQSTIGTFGVLGIVCIIGVKYTCLHSLNVGAQKFMPLLIMPAIGRWAQVLAAALSAYARSGDGVGKVYVDNVFLRHAIYSAMFLLVPLWFLFNVDGLVIFAIVTIVALLVIGYIKDKIGGMTGDTLGAVNEISEVVFLLCFLAMLSP